LRILMIEGNAERREQFQRRYSQWHLPATLEFCSNIYQAMLELARQQPDLLLVDLESNGINGCIMLNTLVGDSKLWTMHIVILSEYDAATLAERGILPQGTVFFGRTVKAEELRDYLQARCTQQVRSSALQTTAPLPLSEAATPSCKQQGHARLRSPCPCLTAQCRVLPELLAFQRAGVKAQNRVQRAVAQRARQQWHHANITPRADIAARGQTDQRYPSHHAQGAIQRTFILLHFQAPVVIIGLPM
jgi:CheY-like chemotaxis protein